MAFTIGIGAGAAALGAAGAAVAAAGAIGLGAAALLGGGRGRRRGGRGRGGFRRRQGRQAVQELDQEHQKRTEAEESEVLQRVLDLIRQQDITGCGMKLVCELAGLKEEELTLEQLAILDIVEPRPTPGEGVKPLSPGAKDFKNAKDMGQGHLDCSLSFPLCSFNGTQLMNIVDAYLP